MIPYHSNPYRNQEVPQYNLAIVQTYDRSGTKTDYPNADQSTDQAPKNGWTPFSILKEFFPL